MTPAIASFVYVFLKAAQQMNVTMGIYKWVIPVSFGMALCEVFIVGFIAHEAITVTEKFLLAFEIGCGAGLGAVCSMWAHKKLRRKKND